MCLFTCSDVFESPEFFFLLLPQVLKQKPLKAVIFQNKYAQFSQEIKLILAVFLKTAFFLDLDFRFF